MSCPKKQAMKVMMVSAASAPIQTMSGLYFMAMSAVANILLSPNSDRKTTPNDSEKGRSADVRRGGSERVGSRNGSCGSAGGDAMASGFGMAVRVIR